MRALLTFSVVVDHDDCGPGVPAREIRSSIKLYREDDGYIWRLDGPYGDAAEVLPRPTSLAQAKSDVRETYPLASAWHPLASWL